MGGAGGKESGLSAGAGAPDGRVSGRERGGGVRGGVEEGTELGREKGPCEILSGGMRHGVRSHCVRPSGDSGKAKRRKLGIFADAQAAIARMTHDEPGPGPSGEEGDSSPTRAGAFCRDREPLVPRAQRTRSRTGGPSRPPASRMTTGPSGCHLPTVTGYPRGQPP